MTRRDQCHHLDDLKILHLMLQLRFDPSRLPSILCRQENGKDPWGVIKLWLSSHSAAGPTRSVGCSLHRQPASCCLACITRRNSWFLAKVIDALQLIAHRAHAQVCPAPLLACRRLKQATFKFPFQSTSVLWLRPLEHVLADTLVTLTLSSICSQTIHPTAQIDNLLYEVTRCSP